MAPRSDVFPEAGPPVTRTRSCGLPVVGWMNAYVPSGTPRKFSTWSFRSFIERPPRASDPLSERAAGGDQLDAELAVKFDRRALHVHHRAADGDRPAAHDVDRPGGDLDRRSAVRQLDRAVGDVDLRAAHREMDDAVAGDV